MQRKNILLGSAVSIISAFVVMTAASAVYQLSIAPTIRQREGERAKTQVMNQSAQTVLAGTTVELERLRDENEALTVELTTIYLENNTNKLIIQALDGVLESEDLYNEGRYKAARQRISAVNPNALAPRPRSWYDNMGIKLSRRGF
jgi:hypothetical protein